MTDATFTTPPGASVWEDEMLRYLEHHVRREGEILDEYQKLADSTESKALAFALRILLDDERKHHAWFRQLGETLRTAAELSADEPRIPWVDFRTVDRTELDRVLAALLRNERQDATELKELRKSLRDMEDTTLWALVVEAMQHDTDKHIALLRGLQHIVKATA